MVLALLLLASTQAFHRPEIIRWGASTAALERNLTPLCARLRTRRIVPPFLDNVRTEQLQIDCDGFQFLGKGRHVEFVIRDDRLVMVWLMVQPSESQQVVSAMRRVYGQPTSASKGYISFRRHRAAWRHKPAEILFYSNELETEVNAWLE